MARFQGQAVDEGLGHGLQRQHVAMVARMHHLAVHRRDRDREGVRVGVGEFGQVLGQLAAALGAALREEVLQEGGGVGRKRMRHPATIAQCERRR